MNILIAFLSRTQNTKIIASQILELLENENNVELLEISEKKRYHFLKLTFAPVRKENVYVSSVIASPKLYLDTFRKKRPKIEDISVNFEKFNLIFLCSPIWYGRLPPAINTFIANYGPFLKTKKIFIIVTSGSGKGFENYLNVLKNEVENIGLTVTGKLHKVNGTYLTKDDKKLIIDCIRSFK